MTRDELFPVACGVATKNLGTTRAPRPARRGRPVARAEGLADRRRGREHGGVRLQDARRPLRGAHQRLPRPRRAPSPPTRPSSNLRTHAKERIGQVLLLQGKEHEDGRRASAGRHRRRREAEGRHRPATCSSTRTAIESPALRPPRAGDELRGHAEDEGRRGEDGHRAPAARRGGSDAEPAPRPADRGGAPLRDEPDARRGRGRAGEAALRRRRRAAPAARPVPRDDPPRGARAGPLQEADRRARPVRRLPHRDRADRRRAGLRVRGQDRRRRHPAELPAGGRQGHPGGDAARRARGRAGAGRARAARRRLVPHRRLVGDGVQDRRLDGVQGARTRRPTPSCSSRSWRSR